MSDPLAGWWQHTVSVERFVSASGGYGDTYTAAEDVTGFYADGTKLITGPSGQQIVVTGQLAFPAGVAYVPVRSKVTLPAQFGGRTAVVVASEVGDGGSQPTPNHQVIGLL